MDPLLQGAEVEPAGADDHQLSIQHDFRLAKLEERRKYLRKVASHRPPAAADQLDFVPVPKDQGPEAVPFGLVLPRVALGNSVLGHRRQHWLHVGPDGQAHGSFPQVSISCGSCGTVLLYRRPYRPTQFEVTPPPQPWEARASGLPAFGRHPGT